MALQNIGASNRNDAFYRYKMPKMVTKTEGKGNGIKTNIVNNVDIAKALARPASYTTKYFGCELGAQSKFDDKTGTSLVNGAHSTSKLASLLEAFIKRYVQCYGCGNPETEIVITKSQMVNLKCEKKMNLSSSSSSSSLSINLNPTHPHFLPSTTTTNTNTCSSSFVSSPVSLGACCPRRSSSISLIRKKSQSLLISASSGSNDMTITEARGEGEESEIEAPLLDPESYSKPRRIALFVEPSPFAYVSGYKNRFQNFIRYLREMGDEVIVVTTHEGVPEEFYGAKVIGSRSFPCPYYQKVPLSLALSPRIISEIARFKPDIIHASSPGIMVFGALAIAKMLSVPIVMSYHTHVPVYIPRYTFSWLVQPMWSIIRFLHRAADLTLVPSAAIGKDLVAAGATAANQLRLWNKGVDSESFNPRFRSQEMRIRLSNGEPEKPLVIHVGRIGVEKSLELLKSVMDKLPEARIAFIGDGPYREDLEKLFTGMPAVFTGMLQGEELSQAYASGDVFVMPSESETLGLVVLEAMASGLPVVAARAGGIPDIIPEEQEGKTGFLFNPGDVEDCVTKLRTLLEDSETRDIIGKAAREETEKYDWRAATTKIRNEQYGAAIWFWRRKKAELLGPLNWLVKRLFPVPPEVNAIKG